jgi:hypothetical protein
MQLVTFSFILKLSYNWSVIICTQITVGPGVSQWYSADLQIEWSMVHVSAGTESFSLHQRVQTGSGTHLVSYPMGTSVSFPGAKAAGAWNRPLTSTWFRGRECVELYLHSSNMLLWRRAQLKSSGITLPSPLHRSLCSHLCSLTARNTGFVDSNSALGIDVHIQTLFFTVLYWPAEVNALAYDGPMFRSQCHKVKVELSLCFFL